MKNSKSNSPLTLSTEGVDKGYTNEKPWRKSDGHLLSDGELAEISSGWDQKTWNEYLDDTVGKMDTDSRTVPMSATDTQLFYDGSEILDSLRNSSKSEKLQEMLAVAMLPLSDREKQILHMRFWLKLSESETAARLNLTKGTVRTYRTRALEKIKHQLLSPCFPNRIKRLKKILKAIDLYTPCNSSGSKG